MTIAQPQPGASIHTATVTAVTVSLVVAATAVLVWLVLFAALLVHTEPRRVEPGPATLDLGGPEPPAIVNLVTGDWDLGQEAVPATLLDLAARGYLAIDQVGDDTFVRLRPKAEVDTWITHGVKSELTRYERMVLNHVGFLSRQTADGVVPAGALTTGPDSERHWWRHFRDRVHEDARQRGLSRARWSRRHKLVLGAVGVVVGACVAVALATNIEPEEDTSTAEHVMGSSWSGVMVAAGIVAAVGKTNGERDTPAGRECAARWLGLREQLADNPLFPEQPPAAVAIWDRHLAYGAAMGVAHGAVQALPLGAESDTVAWSPVGGRWRVVRVRYPRFVPPGYGWHPVWVVLGGLVQLAAAGSLMALVAKVLREQSEYDPQGAALAVGVGIMAVPAGVILIRGAWMVYLGIADLVQGRRTVEGRVVRYRVRGNDKSQRWYVAVDDGTTDRIRAWRFRRSVTAPQGSTVRADVFRRLGHARDLTVVPAEADDRPGPDGRHEPDGRPEPGTRPQPAGPSTWSTPAGPQS